MVGKGDPLVEGVLTRLFVDLNHETTAEIAATAHIRAVGAKRAQSDVA